MGLPKYRPVKRCIFCPNKPDSREHGWSDWAITKFRTPANKIIGEVDGHEHFDPTQKAIKIRCVCIPCNTRWMKALEDAVIPTVGKMADGIPITLDVLQQWTIARWAVAKAMVWEHISRERDIYYSDEDRFNLRLGTVPPNTVMWLARHQGVETFFAAANEASSPPHSPPQLHAYFTTFCYQQVVIQIMTIRPYEHTDPYALINCNQRIWADAIVRIWPTIGKAFWPPMLGLADHMLGTFHKRCGFGDAPINVSIK